MTTFRCSNMFRYSIVRTSVRLNSNKTQLLYSNTPIKPLKLDKETHFSSNSILELNEKSWEQEVQDLSSVSSMNKILGILDDAQNSNPELKNSDLCQSHTKSSRQQVIKNGNKETNIPTNQYLIPSISSSSTKMKKVFKPTIPLKFFKSQRATEIGKDILDYAITKYINNRVMPIYNSKNVDAIINKLLVQIRDLYHLSGSNRYLKDEKYSNNGYLNMHESMARHMVKRPIECLHFLEKDIKDACMNSDLNQELHRYAISRIPISFPESRKESQLESNSEEGYQAFLSKIPFILNDDRLLQTIFPHESIEIRTALGKLVKAYNEEGQKIFGIMIRLQMLDNKTEDPNQLFEKCMNPLIRANITTKSQLFTLENPYFQTLWQVYGDKSLTTSKGKAKIVRQLVEMFNQYFVTWARTNPSAAMDWCKKFVDTQSSTELNEASLKMECLEYYKSQCELMNQNVITKQSNFIYQTKEGLNNKLAY